MFQKPLHATCEPMSLLPNRRVVSKTLLWLAYCSAICLGLAATLGMQKSGMALALVAYTFPVLLPLIAIGHILLRTTYQPPPYGLREGVTWWLGAYAILKAFALLSVSRSPLLLSTGSLLQSYLALAPLGTLVAIFLLWGKRKVGIWLLAFFEAPTIAYLMFLTAKATDFRAFQSVLLFSAPLAITIVWYWRRRGDA
jgi:hypothetical protein